MIFKVGGLQQR